MTPHDYHYTGNVFTPAEFAYTVNRVVEVCRPLEFDSFVFRGTSGCIVGCPVALTLGKPFGIVPKRDTHAQPCYHGLLDPGRYVIIDDMVASGATVTAILDDPRLAERGGRCVALVLYAGHRDCVPAYIAERIPTILDIR